MEQRRISRLSKTSGIADTSPLWVGLLLPLLIFHLSFAVAKIPSSRIDDGGILVPPAIPLPSREVLALRNRSLTLHCPIIVSRDVRILDLWWLKNDTKIDLHQTHTTFEAAASSPRIYITDDGDLHFDKIVHKLGVSDEGDYRCVVKSAMGLARGPIITVSIAALEVKEENAEVKAKAGQPCLLQCQIASTPPLTSAYVTWQRGTTNISHLSQGSDRFGILSSGTLAIYSVLPTDAGIYKCFATHNLLAVNKTAIVTLTVDPVKELISQEPPKFLFPSEYDPQKTIVLDEDEERILDCGASGIPPPITTWVLTYDIVNETAGTISPFSKVLAEGKKYHDSIEISYDHSTEGNYTCIASQGYNSISKTIQVVRLPALLKGPNSYKYPPAKTVRFECKVPPVYDLVWYKDGERLETGRGRVKAKGNEIVVSNTIRNDSGFYQCEVTHDKYVYAIGTARLLVESNREAPDAPFDLQCVESFTKALTIAWKVAAKENITAFTIHYMPIGGEERQKVTPKNTEFHIENLKPYTNYSIYIRSYSAKSASAQSAKVVCTTLEDVPVRAPRNFNFERYGPPSQVRVRWRPLTHSEARGKVIFYKLQWRSIDGEFTNVRYVDGDSEEFLITELHPHEPFELRLIPSTSAGFPVDKDKSPWIRVDSTNVDATEETHSDEYYTSPTMDLTVLNATSILVNWSEPPRPKELSLKGYRIIYAAELSRLEDLVFYEPIYIYNYSETSYLFFELTPSTSYEIQLQTFGDGWESTVTNKFIRTLSISSEDEMSSSNVLPPILGLQVVPLSESEVRLTWEKPKLSLPHLPYYYTIRYNKAYSSEYGYLSSTSESVDIKGLQPYTSYEFAVQVTTGDGQGGPISQKIESRTLAGIPGPPVHLHWRVLNQTLVEVEWQPPSSTNGVIQTYWVQYKHKNQTFESQGRNGSSSANDSLWRNKTTKATSLFLENLLQNEEYLVRVIAETKAGVGHPSDTIFVRIFIRKPTSPEPPLPGNGPPTNPMPSKEHPTTNQHLGIIIGVGLSVVFVILCTVIILSRHRLFPIITRRPAGVHANGNGFPPRAKRSVESFAGVELKVLESLTANDQHLDTKGGHSYPNGILPGPTDPLLTRVVRDPTGGPLEDEEVVPNCIH